MAMGSLTSTIKLHLALWNIGRHYYTGENCEDVYCFCSVDVVFLIFSVVFVRFLVWFLFFCFFFCIHEENTFALLRIRKNICN